MLEDEAAHAEATHEKMKDPLAVAEENLNIRRKRPPRELTRDAVERALNEQVAGAKHSIRMLGGVLDACEKELARLKICREVCARAVRCRCLVLAGVFCVGG